MESFLSLAMSYKPKAISLKRKVRTSGFSLRLMANGCGLETFEVADQR
jgi:hypothetical protein